MKRTEQREHIFKLIFGADFNEESEQGTQTELYLEQIAGVAINEAVNLAKKYSSEDGASFVNGVLAKLAD